jgi:murein DD-endopeptidase MepM/ murein hydrolase activator NlpD
MQSSSHASVQLTALIVFSFFGIAAASAQTLQDHRTSDAPSFKQDNSPAPVAPAPVAPTAAPQLKPVAPPTPSLVIDAATGMVSGEARVVPPPPRVVRQSAGAVAIPSRGPAAVFKTEAASASTPLQVNSGFGYRWGRRHNGVDFQASWGESVGASAAGTVAFAGVKRGYGNLLVLDHGDGISTYYAHLSAIYVGVGQTVGAGQVIGAVGSTGRSSGPHLHYEVRVHGKPINPSATISFAGGAVLVNGQPLEGDAPEPAATEPTSDEAAPAASAAARPRRVLQQPGIEKRVLIYGQNSLTAY